MRSLEVTDLEIDPLEIGEILRIYNLALKAAGVWQEGIYRQRDTTHVLIDHIMYDILYQSQSDGRSILPK